MKQRNTIEQELQDLQINIPVSKMPEMEMPDSYFADFPVELIETIRLQELMDGLPKEMPYDLPQGYFENFADNIMHLLQEENMLSSFPKQLPYQVPDQYFSTFPNQMLSKIKSAEKPFTQVFFSQKLIAKLSLAATILIFMGLAFKIFMFSDITSPSPSLENQLALISDNEINEYMLKYLSEIEHSVAIETDEDAASVDIEKLESDVFDNALNNISDEELLKYTL